MIRHILIYLLLMVPALASAQADRAYVRSGNRLFRAGKFDRAEVAYRKAVAANPRNSQALYNLGCALQRQGKDSSAVVQYQAAGKLEKGRLRRAMIYHNIGTVCQGHKLYGEAIEAYKESLRNNPNDDQTRYNLALCQRHQKNNKNQQQNQQNRKQNKKDKNKDKNKNKQDRKQNQKQKQQSAPRDKKMSRENAEQLLNAAMQEEKNTQQRLKKAMQQPGRRRLQKNW